LINVKIGFIQLDKTSFVYLGITSIKKISIW